MMSIRSENFEVRTAKLLAANEQVLLQVWNSLLGRVGQSISALAAHRTLLESLPSYGSCYSVNI